MTKGATVIAGLAGALGRALCVEFCIRGHPVAGLGASEEEIDVIAAAGPLFMGIVCDVGDPTAVRAAFREVRARIGPVSILVNNSGPRARLDILDETAEGFMAAIQAHLGGMVACTREALSDMISEGKGRILNVAGSAEASVVPASAAFAVSNEAGRTFTRALVADLSDRFPRIVTSDWIPSAVAMPADGFDGIDHAQAARWAVTLALMQEPSLNGTTWQGNRELPPPRSIRRRIADRLLGRYVEGRVIS